MKNLKILFSIFFLMILLGSLFFPLTSQAAGIYKANDRVICYEGLVPCGPGKPYWKDGIIVDGKCQGTKVDKGITCQFCHFFVMFKRIIDFVLQLVIVIAVLMLVIGGVMFFAASGDPAKVNKAKSLLTAVAIGLIIIFSAWVIVNTFFIFIGLSEFGLKLTGPDKWFIIDCPIKL
ncbi:MAG: hypothetical protein DDT19_02622 [Syntrophomonadaceae bacterium]|nr:hypothetical protein [Bacillota bacterium]